MEGEGFEEIRKELDKLNSEPDWFKKELEEANNILNDIKKKREEIKINLKGVIVV